MVQASNDVAVVVVDFHARLGIEQDREALEATRWMDAAADVRDRVLETGTEGVGAARDFGADTFGRARAATGKLSGRIAERVGRRRKDDEDDADQD